MIERAVILANDGQLEVDLPEHPASAGRESSQVGGPARSSLDEVRRAHILKVLDSTDWVIAGPRSAAIKLGMKRSTPNFRIKKLGVTRDLRRERCFTDE